MHVTDREGKHQPAGLKLSQIGTGKATMMLGDTDNQRTVRIELKPDGDGGIDGARLLDQRGRVIAERNAPRWLFSAPVLHALLVWGRAQNVVVRTKMVNIDQIVGEGSQLKPAGVLGLPVRGLHPWHICTQDRNDGLKRVSNGAPPSFDRVGPNEEVARVEAVLKAAQLGGGLESLLGNMVIRCRSSLAGMFCLALLS